MLMLALGLIAFGASARTWTFSQDGTIETQAGAWTFKKGGRIDAELQGMKGTNTVVLRRSDGVLCDVPLEVLSEKDQDFVLHPPEDRRPERTDNKVNEAAKIERYWRGHALNIIDDIEPADFSSSAKAQAACNEIVAAMARLTNAVQQDLAFTNFVNLLQNEAFAVEKIKETSIQILPRSFLHHTDEFFRFMMNSRDDWADELKGKTPDYRDFCIFLRERGWALAKVHFLYCAGIAQKSPDVYAAIIEAEAAIIQSEQAMTRKRKNGTAYPLLHAMTPSEIADRLRVERGAVLAAPN